MATQKCPISVQLLLLTTARPSRAHRWVSSVQSLQPGRLGQLDRDRTGLGVGSHVRFPLGVGHQPARQVEAVELMAASNTITVAHADALLKATPPEQRTDFEPTERDKQLVPIVQIVKLEKEMGQVQTQYKDAEENYGSDLPNLVVAKGYLTNLLGNDAVKSNITRHEPEILEHFELVVNTMSMEEAVQQLLEADGGCEEPPKEEAPAQ